MSEITGNKRQFKLQISIGGHKLGTATIELDQSVIDAVDDDWRASLYDLYTPGQIAEHIGYNLIVNDIPLSSMDGWADQPDSNARVQYVSFMEDYDIEAMEVTCDNGEK